MMSVIRRHALIAGLGLIEYGRPVAADPAAPPSPPPALRLVTSELPPFAIDAAPGGRRGVLVELVETLLKRAGLPAQAKYYPWARALLLAGAARRTLILPLNRTPEREDRFQWLLKLYTQRFVFVTLSNRPRVENPEQARELRLSVLRGSSNLGRLQQLGLSLDRLYQAANIGDMHRALERGLVDAIYGSELIHTDAWQRRGRDPAMLQIGMALESADIWLAAQGGVTEAEQAALRQQQEAMLTDGSMERLFRRYGIKFRPEDVR